MTISKIISKLKHLDFADYGLLLETVCYVSLAKAAVHLCPFRILTSFLGQQNTPPPTTSHHNAAVPTASSQQEQPHHAKAKPTSCSSNITDTHLRRISWAIRNTSRYLPWPNPCLVQAIAGQWILRWRGIESSIYLGVSHKPNSEIQAHAWLQSGAYIITGDQNIEPFTTLLVFTQAARSQIQ
jgi:hypothetical protein